MSYGFLHMLNISTCNPNLVGYVIVLTSRIFSVLFESYVLNNIQKLTYTKDSNPIIIS